MYLENDNTMEALVSKCCIISGYNKSESNNNSKIIIETKDVNLIFELCPYLINIFSEYKNIKRSEIKIKYIGNDILNFAFEHKDNINKDYKKLKNLLSLVCFSS